MAYKLVKDHPELRAHMAKHLPGSAISGSVFTHSRFSTYQQVIQFAYDQIASAYNGRVMYQTLDYGETVGLEGIIALKDIPRGITVKKQTRVVTNKGESGRSKSYSVNTAYMLRTPTSQITIIAGPIPETEIHGIFTVFPGRWAPDFTDNKFWGAHALIIESKKGKRK